MDVSVVDAGPRRVSRSAEVGAPAAELFDMVADPRRHRELDGSGTVIGTVDGPARLAMGDEFTVRMRMHGVPYRITSKVTEFVDGQVVEWRHPMGHRWRWELSPAGGGMTQVTETFDYSGISPFRARILEAIGMTGQNGRGIEATLHQLRAKYPIEPVPE
jgi:uncharacterized protein YndB with AHSA1/START domain